MKTQIEMKLTNHVEHLSTSTVETEKPKRRKIPMLDYKGLLNEFEGRKVQVYWNLHKKCFSLKCPKSGLVLAHTNDFFTLRRVRYVVRQAGRRKVIEQKRKNVHAFVYGILVNAAEVTSHNTERVTYNPYRDETFVESTEDRKPITASPWALVLKHSQTGKPIIAAYKRSL
jgi:hypothetical protein